MSKYVKERSDKDIADDLLELFHKEIVEHSNMGAIIRTLARKSKKVREIFFNALAQKKPGRPKRYISDKDVFRCVEAKRKELEVLQQPNQKKRVTDKQAIIAALSATSSTRIRLSGQDDIFRPNSDEGKREFKRVQAAYGRGKQLIESEKPPQ